jgi:hypothetical protein
MLTAKGHLFFAITGCKKYLICSDHKINNEDRKAPKVGKNIR